MPQDINQQLEKTDDSFENGSSGVKLFGQESEMASKITEEFSSVLENGREITAAFQKRISATTRSLTNMQKRGSEARKVLSGMSRTSTTLNKRFVALADSSSSVMSSFDQGAKSSKDFKTELGYLQKESIGTSEVFSDVTTKSSGMADSFKEAASSSNNLTLAVHDQNNALNDNIDEVDAARKATDALEKSENNFNKAVKKHTGLLGFLNDKFEEGQEQGERFANGMFNGATGMMAAGGAAVFLLKQLNDLLVQMKSTAIGFAKFRVESELLAKTALIPGGVQQLQDLRREMGVTTDQFGEFKEILNEVAVSGLASIGRMKEVSKQLRDTFGGEQLDRLKQYVGLLKEIPTLETDLSITASMDDRAAAAFALASSGKVQQVMELQTAGLFGDIEMAGLDEARERDKKLLNVAKDTSVFAEDISQTLHGFFPVVGPQITAAAEGISSIGKGVGGLVVALGALRFLLGLNSKAQISAQNATTFAVYSTAGKTSRVIERGVMKGFGRLMRGKGLGAATQKVIKRSALKIGGRGLAKSLPGVMTGVTGGVQAATGSATSAATGGVATGGGGILFAKTIGGAVKALFSAPVVIGAAATAIGVGVGILGDKIANKGDEIAEAGDKLKGGLAQVAGGMTKYAGTVGAGAGMGLMLGGPVGAAVGAGVGVIAGIAIAMEDVGTGIENIGKKFSATLKTSNREIPKYNETIQGLGLIATEVGGKFRKMGEQVNLALEGLAIKVSSMTNVAKEWVSETWRGIVYSEGANDEFKKQSKAELKQAKIDYKLKIKEIQLRRKTFRQQAKQMMSMIELQKSFGRLEAASNNLALGLFDLRKDVAQLELENLVVAGKNADDFSMTIEEGGKAMMGRFEKMGRQLERERIRIKNNTKLTEEDRKTAETKLKSFRLQALQQFTRDLLDMSAQFDKIPEAILNNLQIELRKARIEVGTGAGAMSTGDLFENLSLNIEDSLKNLELATEQASTEYADQLELMQKASEPLAMTIAELADEAKKVKEENDRANKELENVDQQIERQTELYKAIGEEIAKLEQQGSEDPRRQKRLLRLRVEEVELGAKLLNLNDRRKELGERTNEQEKERITLFIQQQALVKREIEEKKKNGAEQEEINKLEAENVLLEEGLAQKKDAIKNLGIDREQIVKDMNKQAKSLMDEESRENLLQELRAKKQKELLDSLRKVTQSIADIANSIDQGAEVQLAQRRLEILESQEELLYATENAWGVTSKILEATNEHVEASLVAIKKANEDLEDLPSELEETENKIRKLERKDSLTDVEKENLEDLEGQRETIIKQIEKTRHEVEKKYNEINQTILRGIERLANDASEAIKKSIDYKATAAIGEAAQASAELAGAMFEFSNMALGTDEAIRMAIKNHEKYNSELREQLEIIRDTDLSELLNMDGLTREQKKLLKERGKEYVIAKGETELAKSELELKRQVVSLAEAERDARLVPLEIQGEILDAQESFFSSMGATYGQIFELQKQSLMIEGQKLAIAKQHLAELEAGPATAEQLERARGNVIKQQIALQQAALGRQRDTYEKLAALAFGQLRNARGARKGITSMQRLLGVENTRFQTASGLYAPGEPGTLAQRRAEMGAAAGLGQRSQLGIGPNGFQFVGGRGGTPVAGMPSQGATVNSETGEIEGTGGTASRAAVQAGLGVRGSREGMVVSTITTDQIIVRGGIVEGGEQNTARAVDRQTEATRENTEVTERNTEENRQSAMRTERAEAARRGVAEGGMGVIAPGGRGRLPGGVMAVTEGVKGGVGKTGVNKEGVTKEEEEEYKMFGLGITRRELGSSRLDEMREAVKEEEYEKSLEWYDENLPGGVKRRTSTFAEGGMGVTIRPKDVTQRVVTGAKKRGAKDVRGLTKEEMMALPPEMRDKVLDKRVALHEKDLSERSKRKEEEARREEMREREAEEWSIFSPDDFPEEGPVTRLNETAFEGLERLNKMAERRAKEAERKTGEGVWLEEDDFGGGFREEDFYRDAPKKTAPKKENLSYSPVSNMATKGQAELQADLGVEVEGKVKVEFDNAMFRVKVAEVIGSAEVVRKLGNLGFVQKA